MGHVTVCFDNLHLCCFQITSVAETSHSLFKKSSLETDKIAFQVDLSK